jgi:hypothetical protein
MKKNHKIVSATVLSLILALGLFYVSQYAEGDYEPESPVIEQGMYCEESSF